MNNHEKFMKLAIKEALSGKKKGEPSFAGIMVNPKGKIVAKAHDTVRKHGDMTRHSEIDLIRATCRKVGPDLTGYTVYCTCEPCPLCFGAIWLAKVSTVVFGSYISDVLKITGSQQRELDIRAEELNRKSGSQIKIIEEVLRKECINLWKGKK